MKLARTLIGLAVVITACGGGSAGDSSTTTVAPSTTVAPTTTSTTTTVPTTTTTTVPPTTTLPPTTTTTAPLDPSYYKELSERDYALLVRNADEHIGELVTIYGGIWQFDTITGPDQFLAHTSSVEHSRFYEYDEDALLIGTADMFHELVEDDFFKAYVRGGGSWTYDTAIGGSNTVAVFFVDDIEYLGHRD